MSIYDRDSFQSVLMVALQAIYSTPSPVTGAFLTFLLWYIIKKTFDTHTQHPYLWQKQNLYGTTLITIPKVLWYFFCGLGRSIVQY